MPARPTHGVVSLPALDLRAAPSHSSEMRSQLLMGEVVRIQARSPDGQWLRVKNLSDGYSGWSRGWGLVEATGARASTWRKLARVRVVESIVEIRVRPGAGGIVTPLYWGAVAIPRTRRARFLRVELPDGRCGWGPSAGFAAADRAGLPLRERILSLAGVPYLWGGRTPFGLDCSGFTQLLLGEQGVSLPRDSAQQFRSCRALGKLEKPSEGDLAFFGRAGEAPSHVGIALGDGYFAHVRGRVRLASLEPHNPLYDNEIGPQFRGFRRPLMVPRARVFPRAGRRKSA